jgi:DNA ligase (NAD+)
VEEQSEKINLLGKIGFQTSPGVKKFLNTEEILEEIEQSEKKREELEFESDGIVIKVNKIKSHKILGETSRFPR